MVSVVAPDASQRVRVHALAMQEVVDTVAAAHVNTVVYLVIPVVVRIVGDAVQQMALGSRELVDMDHIDAAAGH